MSATPVGRRSPALPGYFLLGSSFLVMSIIGGAALTALMGLSSDLSNIRTAMLVPAICFAVVAWLGLTERSARSTFSTPRPYSQSTSP